MVSEEERTGSDDTSGLQFTSARASEEGARSESRVKKSGAHLRGWFEMNHDLDPKQLFFTFLA